MHRQQRFPTLRWDPINARWNLLAPHRRDTPRDLTSRADAVREGLRCPFCPGHEGDTEPAVEQRLDADGRWLARAVSNRYPMVGTGGVGEVRTGFFRERAAVGRHEVIVESPRHDVELSDLDVPTVIDVISLWTICGACRKRSRQAGCVTRSSVCGLAARTQGCS